MKFKLAAAAILVGVGVAALPGCAVDGAANEAEAEQAETSEAELHSNAARIAGAYHGDHATVPPSFQGLVLTRDGKFFADVDTGIRCIMAPCPSHVRAEGTFFATRHFLYLSPKGGSQANGGIGGWYRYEQINAQKFSLNRLWGSSWQQSLAKETSYCAQPTDCAQQDLMQPRCLGEWTCSTERTCAYKCGPIGSDIWPVTATKLVAHNAGGGFTPPAPPGSTCTVGYAKYTLDVTSSKLDWEECSFVDWQTPMHIVSGQKTLTGYEYGKVDAAMRDVKLSQQEICGADKPFLSIEVTSSAGVKKYSDSFYSCNPNLGGPFVDNIDGVFSAFRDVAH